MALERTGFAADECMVVENAPLGVMSARQLVSRCSRKHGKVADEALTEKGADRLFHTTTELAEALTKKVREERGL